MEQVTLDEIRSWKKNGVEFRLIDVRDASERSTFHIGGEWIPLPNILRELIPVNIETPIVLYCKKGIRSQIAIQKLTRKYPQIRWLNLKGGIGLGEGQGGTIGIH